MTIALTREVSARFELALAASAPAMPIDVGLARAQHAAYGRALAALGLDVITLPGDDAHPDCVFVEDTAVVARGLAVITRPGAPSRRGEVDEVARWLATRGIDTARLDAPATLDGGDCLRLGDTIYVGRSARTSREGIEALARAFAPREVRVVGVALPADVLHLKCVASPLGDDRVLLARGTLDAATFGGADVVWAPHDERYAANAVAHGGSALVADGFPRTREALERAGVRTIAVACTEVRKADGSLTCQSILI